MEVFPDHTTDSSQSAPAVEDSRDEALQSDVTRPRLREVVMDPGEDSAPALNVAGSLATNERMALQEMLDNSPRLLHFG